MGATGTIAIDFGAFPGGTDATVLVTGQAGILSGSLVEAWIFPTATAVHSVDEHYMAAAMIEVLAGEVVAGTGFTIRAMACDLRGQQLAVPARNDSPRDNTTYIAEPQASIGGQCLNNVWGTFTVAWVWN